MKNREMIASLFAPLCVPAVCVLPPANAIFVYSPLGITVCVVMAYLTMFVMGRPVYLFCKARGRATLIMALISGSLVGVLSYLIFMFVIGLMLNESIALITSLLLADFPKQYYWLALMAVSGAITGGVFWLIAGPSRAIAS